MSLHNTAGLVRRAYMDGTFLLTFESIICPECHSTYHLQTTNEYTEITHSRGNNIMGLGPSGEFVVSSDCSRMGETHIFKRALHLTTQHRIEPREPYSFLQIYGPKRTCPYCNNFLSKHTFLDCGLRIKLYHPSNCKPVILPLALFTVFI